MKKIVFFTTLLVILSESGCAKKEVDPYQTYRGKTLMGLFMSGERALAKKDYSKAIKNFQALNIMYPFDPHAKQAQLDIIYAYYKRGDTALAIAAIDRYIRLYPRGRNIDYAYYMRGMASFDSGLSWIQKLTNISPVSRDISTLQRSFASFSNLVKMFPYSRYAPDALTRMRYIRNLIAQHEMIIAEFYMKRGDYMAAISRANYVVQHFQGSPQVIRGLAIMVRAYRALNLPKMVDASCRLLQTNLSAHAREKKFEKNVMIN